MEVQKHIPPSQFQKASLPGREKCRAPAFIGSEGVQGAAWRNEGGLEPVFVGHGVPAAAQRFGSSLHSCSRSCANPAAADRPGGFRQGQTPFGRLTKGLTAARRKMAEFGRLARGKGLR